MWVSVTVPGGHPVAVVELHTAIETGCVTWPPAQGQEWLWPEQDCRWVWEDWKLGKGSALASCHHLAR